MEINNVGSGIFLLCFWTGSGWSQLSSLQSLCCCGWHLWPIHCRGHTSLFRLLLSSACRVSVFPWFLHLHSKKSGCGWARGCEGTQPRPWTQKLIKGLGHTIQCCVQQLELRKRRRTGACSKPASLTLTQH